jgi:hypothetical protein
MLALSQPHMPAPSLQLIRFWPRGQGSHRRQDDARGKENFPCGQLLHELSPALLENFPESLQCVQ